jgi:protein gp37
VGADSKIEWTDHTFNPWIGCTRVSPGCDHCYAESMANRYGWAKWGQGEKRRRTSEANWLAPLRWDVKAKAVGRRLKVFCASLADVFDNEVPEEWRADLFHLIERTPNLDWLLLTKRIGNVPKMTDWRDEPHDNVWLGISVVNQEEADRDIPKLQAIPARVHFLSCEPLLGAIDFRKVPGFNRVNTNLYGWWVIVGGESGAGARMMDPEWARGLRDLCSAGHVPFFMKQMTKKAPIPDDLMVRQFPFYAPLNDQRRGKP